MSKYDIASRVCQYGNGSRFIWLDVISFLTTQTHANFNSNEPFTWFHWCAHEMRPTLSISFWIFSSFLNFGFLFIWRDCIFGEQKAELFWFSFLFFIFWLFCYYWMKSVWKVCLLEFHHVIIAFNCRSVLVTPMTKTCQVSSWLVCYFLLSVFWDVTRFKTLTDIPSKNHTNAQRQLNMSITKCTLW